MLNIEAKHLAVLKGILEKHPYEFFVFGSRVRGDNKKFSDLDLAYKAEIPKAELSLIREEFEQSKLPYKIDLVDLKSCTEEFKQLIINDLVLVKQFLPN